MDDYRPISGKKDHSLLKIVGIGAGCLLLIGGIGAFFISRFYFYMRGPTKMLNDHIQAINSGNYEAAYLHFSQDLKRDTSYQDFRLDLEEFSSLLPSQDSTFSDVKILNNKATVEGTMTGRDGAIFPIAYVLIKEKGVWKISTYHWTSPGERIRV
jgi:hypothetical protein